MGDEITTGFQPSISGIGGISALVNAKAMGDPLPLSQELDVPLEQWQLERIIEESYEALDQAAVQNCSALDCYSDALKIERLKALYEAAENVRYKDMPRDDMISIYDDFLAEYSYFLDLSDDKDDLSAVIKGYTDQVTAPYQKAEFFKSFKEHFDKVIGISPYMFSDKGAHYVDLLATKIQGFADEAEYLNSDDFLQYDKYFTRQSELYNDAAAVFSANDNHKLVFLLDQEELELKSGYQLKYLKDQTSLKSYEAMEYAETFADENVQLESDPVSVESGSEELLPDDAPVNEGKTHVPVLPNIGVAPTF